MVRRFFVIVSLVLALTLAVAPSATAQTPTPTPLPWSSSCWFRGGNSIRVPVRTGQQVEITTFRNWECFGVGWGEVIEDVACGRWSGTASADGNVFISKNEETILAILINGRCWAQAPTWCWYEFPQSPTGWWGRRLFGLGAGDVVRITVANLNDEVGFFLEGATVVHGSVQVSIPEGVSELHVLARASDLNPGHTVAVYINGCCVFLQQPEPTPTFTVTPTPTLAPTATPTPACRQMLPIIFR